MMTFAQFLARLRMKRGALRKGPLKWGAIRLSTVDRFGRKRSCCPIDAVGGDWTRPGGGIGLSGRLRSQIVAAADNRDPGTPRRRAVRAAMLRALGVS